MKKILAVIIVIAISIGTVSGVYAAEEIADESLISEIMETETAVISESELQEEIILSEETAEYEQQEDDIDPHFTGSAFKDEVWGYYTDGVLQTSLNSVIRRTVDGEKA